MSEPDIGTAYRREMETLMNYLKDEIPKVVCSIDERIALPPDASLEVKLVDISKQDVPAETIAEQKITNPGQVPIPFELWYDPDKIDPRMTYAVQARIEQGGKLLFISTRVFPVITRGNSTHVEVKVDPVK